MNQRLLYYRGKIKFGSNKVRIINSTRDNDGLTALGKAILKQGIHISCHKSKRSDLKMVKILLNHQADPQELNTRVKTALHLAASLDLEFLPMLLEQNQLLHGHEFVNAVDIGKKLYKIVH